MIDLAPGVIALVAVCCVLALLTAIIPDDL